MKFQKIVIIGVEESYLDAEYWKKLDDVTDSWISLPTGDLALEKELKDADCIITWFGVSIDKAVIDLTPKLKHICIIATAYNAVDTDYAAKKGVVVSNVAGYSTESVAEFIIAALLHQIRGLEEGRLRAKAGNYSFNGITAHELKNSKFGVIGLGNIGTRVAELAMGFGAKVSYWSRTKKNVLFEYTELDKLLSSCDYISINTAVNDDTKKLLDERNLSLLRPGSTLICTVPPEVIDVDALVKRLAKGDIKFITDQPDEMPKDDIAKLSKYENCIFFPPIAFISVEARKAKQDVFISNLKGFLESKPQNVVN